jgi:hypothetical protein
MIRRVFGPIAILAVVGALAIGAVAYAASAVTSTPAPAQRSAPAFNAMPAADHHGDCPNMGGDSSGSSGSSDSGSGESSVPNV